MQDQKTAGQAEDWELSEAYYKEDTGKKELRLEDFLEEETAEGQSGLADGSSLNGAAGSNGCAGKRDPGAFRNRAFGGSDCSMLGMDGQQVRDILVCMRVLPGG